MDIQTGVYGNYQKVIDENGKEVLRLVSAGGASSPATATAQYFDVPFDKIPAAELAKIPVGGIISAKVHNFSLPAHMTFLPIYLGGSGASDTIVDGRGVSPSFPFETMTAALAYVLSAFGDRYRVRFIFLGDVDEGNDKIINFGDYDLSLIDVYGGDGLTRPVFNFGVLNSYRAKSVFYNLTLRSHNTRKNVYFQNVPSYVVFTNVAFAQESGYGVYASQSAHVRIDDCVFTGTGEVAVSSDNGGHVWLGGPMEINGSYNACALWATRGGSISIWGSVTGTATGRKYILQRGGYLYATEEQLAVLPGTIAGTCDEFSTIA